MPVCNGNTKLQLLKVTHSVTFRTVSIELAGAVALCPGEVWMEAAVAAPRVHTVQPGVPALAVAPVLAQVPALVVVTVPAPESFFIGTNGQFYVFHLSVRFAVEFSLNLK